MDKRIATNHSAGTATCKCGASRYGSRRELAEWSAAHVCVAPMPRRRELPEHPGGAVPAPQETR